MCIMKKLLCWSVGKGMNCQFNCGKKYASELSADFTFSSQCSRELNSRTKQANAKINVFREPVTKPLYNLANCHCKPTASNLTNL